MSFETELSSNTFNIEHTSQQINFQKHFHKKQIQIINEDRPRKVIFGQMELQQRSVYQIVSPYIASMAKTTGNFAYEAGSIAYEYLKQGFWWFYDQMTNKVIPYTREEIPKLIFIISKSAKAQNSIKSGQFCVLEMQDEDYKEISRKQQRQSQGPIKVLIPLGSKDEALIQEIKRNHEVSYSFPINDLDDQSERISVTYCIPSESYEIIEGEAKAALREQRSKVIDITQFISQKNQSENQFISINKQQKQNPLSQSKQKPDDFQKQNLQKSSIQEEEEWQEVKGSFIRQKSKPKAIFLPDACCFIYEQENQLYPFLKDILDQDSKAVTGHLISSDNFKKNESKDFLQGRVQLIKVDQKIGKTIDVRKEVEAKQIEMKTGNKFVDMERKVRPQIEPNLDVHQNKMTNQYGMQLN